MSADSVNSINVVKPLIEQRADPYIYKHTDGTYYFTASVPEYDRVELRAAKTIAGLAEAEAKVLWRKHEKGIMSQHIWAPEIHYVEGGWYIYFAASDVDDIWALRPYVLRCTGSDPMVDPWEEMGQMQPSEGDDFAFTDFSLDMTVFQHKNVWYTVWAQKVNNISNLYIAELAAPNRLKTKPVLITEPDHDWEQVDFWVNEGPAVIHHGDKLFLTFSASGTGACYCMGLLTAQEDADLLKRESWVKTPTPVLVTSPEHQAYGPGHNSFTVDENGEDLVIYHARPYEKIVGDPLYDPNRHACVMKLIWDEKGYPVFRF
mgnify:CR=1 FL=1